MKQFLERHNLAKFTQEEIDDLNGPISIKEIESIINCLTKQKASGPDGFISKSYQKAKVGIAPIFYKVFQRIETEGILPNSFCSYTQIKNITKMADHYLS